MLLHSLIPLGLCYPRYFSLAFFNISNAFSFDSSVRLDCIITSCKDTNSPICIAMEKDMQNCKYKWVQICNMNSQHVNLAYLVILHASQIGNIACRFIPTHIKTLYVLSPYRNQWSSSSCYFLLYRLPFHIIEYNFESILTYNTHILRL